MKRVVMFTVCVFMLGMAGTLEAATTWFRGHRFESYVMVHRKGKLPEQKRGSKCYLQVREGDEYSIVIRNPLPVTVGVAVTVDGLNTIDGKRTSPDRASKWILGPHGSMTIRGWQTGSKSLRRFVFTREKESYARWKGKHDRKQYTRNLGVIGVAFFWDSRELQRVLNPPLPFSDRDVKAECEERLSRTRKKRAGGVQESKRAGTGMGRHEHNRVRKVHFIYDTGMTTNSDVMKIYYEFGEYCGPKPFLDSDTGFAPEMPVSKSKKRSWFPFLKR